MAAGGPIRSAADLPFPVRDPFELLGFRPGRALPDLDYAGFGHARVPAIELVGDEEGTRTRVLAPQVLALHSADDGAALADDVELEFWVDPATAIAVPLSLFLRARAPAVIDGSAPVVLALCNPYRAALTRPPALAGPPIYYALGDVIAHLDAPEGAAWDLESAEIRLHAPAWRVMS